VKTEEVKKAKCCA